MLISARDLINLERNRSINAVRALLRTVDLSIDARTSLAKKQFALIAAWRTRQEDLTTATARREATRLAKRVIACDEELTANRHEITALVAASEGSALPDEPGIGAINAAVIIVTGRTLGGSARKPRSP